MEMEKHGPQCPRGFINNDICPKVVKRGYHCPGNETDSRSVESYADHNMTSEDCAKFTNEKNGIFFRVGEGKANFGKCFMQWPQCTGVDTTHCHHALGQCVGDECCPGTSACPLNPTKMTCGWVQLHGFTFFKLVRN